MYRHYRLYNLVFGFGFHYFAFIAFNTPQEAKNYIDLFKGAKS